MESSFLERLRDAAYDDLTAFAEYINPDEPPALHHRYVCEKLMLAERGENPRMLVSMPPGSAKSSYCSRMYPAWFLGRNPKKKFLQAGHTQNFVESQFGKKTRDIVGSQAFNDIFPEVTLASDSKAAGLWSLNNPYGGYAAKGVGQAIAGFRAHMAVVDDPVGSRADAESAVHRQHVFDWFTADFMTRLLPNSPLFIVATRWHSDDLCGRIEDMSKKGQGIPYEIINIPAIAEEDDDLLGRKIGDPLWPEFTSLSFFQSLQETISAKNWNSLYMGTPVDENAGVVKSEWFQRYHGDPKSDKIATRITISVDTASKTAERNDYTAVLTWLQDTSGNHYLLNVERKKLEFNEMCVLIDTTAKRFGASAILVEDKGSGTQYIQTRQGKAPAPIIPVSTTAGSKEFRFDSITPMFEAGEVFLPDRAMWLAEYEKELLSFPLGKHDDQVDATSQYLNWARSKKSVGGTSKISNSNSGGSRSHAVKQVEEAIQKMIALREASKLGKVSG